MKEKVKSILKKLYYSFPVQLLGLHLKKNQFLLVLWLLLFSIIIGDFGRSLGIPFLFLDPEYLGKVNFLSFFIMGVVISGFSISFMVTTYIIDSPRFSFLSWLPKPFSRFSLNNSVIPLGFFFTYAYQVYTFQLGNDQKPAEAWLDLAGLATGFVFMTTILFSYFRLTNKDIFKYVVCKVDEKIREKVPATKFSVFRKYKRFKMRQVRVDTYLELKKGLIGVPDHDGFYDTSTLLRVFNQNHFNLVSVQMVIFVLLLGLGLFVEVPEFQIPAAASFVLLLTIILMLSGAFSYWFRGWSFTIAIVFLLILNLFIRTGIIETSYHAFGIDYEKQPSEYNVESIAELSTKQSFSDDYLSTIQVLNNWRSKFEEDPKIVFIAASGGGQRSMLWCMNALQRADSITGGQLLENTVLMTGASGGLIGASYFRELNLRKKLGEVDDPLDRMYLEEVSRDNLNPVIFSLLVNDLFLGFQRFEYGGFRYKKDRGYAFEQQINRNTRGFLDRELQEYRKFELEAEIPMLIMGPTIINDGRKMFISPLDISFMNLSTLDEPGARLKGVEFREFLGEHGAERLRFLSALRMNATFPYITPNITLPSKPAIEIMDAGITDNFGIADAVRFITVFSDWIEYNTSGVVILSVRDSQKNNPVEEKENRSLFQKFFSPIHGFYKNFESIQDINNDTGIENISKWFRGNVYVVSLEYNSANNLQLKDRASLSWRLTQREKRSILENIYSSKNMYELSRLRDLLAK